MKKKGFTLIELLAVIVILAVIALISVPIILNVVEKAKKNALVDSAYGILKAGNLYYMEKMSKKEVSERYDFKINEGVFVLEQDSKETLKFRGKVPETGILQIHPNGNSAIGICNSTYCACKSVSELKVTLKDSNCNINSETGEIEKEENITFQKLKELEDKINNLEKEKVLPGTVISYMAGSSAPEGYLPCNGKTYNISDYPKLANSIKDGFGSYNYYGGDGITTFAVPDLRGEFLRGTGTNSHTNQGSGTSVGKHQDATYLPFYGVKGNTFNYYTNKNTVTGLFPKNTDYRYKDETLGAKYITPTADFTDTTTQTTNYMSTRPTNTSVLYCIKY